MRAGRAAQEDAAARAIDDEAAIAAGEPAATAMQVEAAVVAEETATAATQREAAVVVEEQQPEVLTPRQRQRWRDTAAKLPW